MDFDRGSDEVSDEIFQTTKVQFRESINLLFHCETIIFYFADPSFDLDPAVEEPSAYPDKTTEVSS